MSSSPRTIFHVDMDAFFVSVEELFDPSLKGKPVVVGGQRTSAGWSRRLPMRRGNTASTRQCLCARPPRLCPQAIFVDGHPERYREYSGKFARCCTILAAGGDGVHRRGLSGYDRHRATARPPLRAAHRLHERDEVDDAVELLDRDSQLSTGRESRPPTKPSRNGILWVLPGGSGVSRAAGCSQDSRGRQGHGEEVCTHWASRKSATWRAWTRVSWRSGSGNGGWHWRAKLGAWMPVAGSMTKSARTEILNRSATNIRSTLIPLTWNDSSPRWRDCAKWWAGGCGNMDYYARTVQLKLRYKDFSTITRAHTLDQRHPTRHRNLQRDPQTCFSGTGTVVMRCVCWECRRRTLRKARRSSTCWNHPASSAGGRRSRPSTISATNSANRASVWPPA